VRTMGVVALNYAKPGFESADQGTHLFCNSLFRLVRISKILTCLGRLGQNWAGLGRMLGRIEWAKYSMFTGLETVGRINWRGIRV
jgi:hypothetical protein